MADVFISYSSADRPRVSVLANALEKDGLSVWWDRSLVPGDSYETEIDAALNAAKAAIVVWSPAASASEWVRSEADDARQAGKLVPVLVEAVRIPKPFDRFHTADLTQWRGDRGNNNYPELVEALKARVEGRAARPIPWKRRLTLAAIGGVVLGGLTFVFSALPAADMIMRWTNTGPYVERVIDKRTGGETNVPPETREGFRVALQALSRSFDLRTQKALSTFDHGDRQEALRALAVLAQDQSGAVDAQMTSAGTLWRQLGLMQFNTDPGAALIALENARRYASDDPYVLLPLGALLQRQGKTQQAEALYRTVLSGPKAVEPSVEAHARQVIAQGLIDRGDYSGAASELDKALAAATRFEGQGADDLTADLMIDQGRVALARADLDGAIGKINEARDFAAGIPYDRGVLFASLNLATADISAKRLDAAQSSLDQARQLAAAQGDKVADIYVLIYSSDLALARNDPDTATNFARNAVTAASAVQLGAIVNDAQMSLAQALFASGRTEEASKLAANLATSFLQGGASSDLAVAHALASTNAPNSTLCGRLLEARKQAAASHLSLAALQITDIARRAKCSV